MHFLTRLIFTRRSAAPLGVFFALVGALRAQIVIMPPSPGASTPASVARDLSTGTKRSASPSSLASALASQRPLLKTGMFSYTAGISYRYSDGTRLRTETGNDRDTAIQTVIFTGGLSVGKHWSLSHSSTKSFYSNEEFRDPLDHSASVSAGYALGEWLAAGSLSYSRQNDTILEIGAQTTRDIYNGGVSFSRGIGERTSLELSFNYNVGFATGLVSGRTFSTTDSLNYEISRRMKAGVSVSYGMSFMNAGADSTSIRPEAHFSWQLSPKTSLSASAGYEYREFDTRGRSRLTNPVYGVSLSYRPVQTTSLSVSASASEGSSYFVNRTTHTTGVSFNLEQRLLGRLFLGAGYNLGRAKYYAIDRDLTVDRQDKNHGFSVNLSTAFLQRASASISYGEVTNTSGTTRFSLSSHQYSFTLNYRF